MGAWIDGLRIDWRANQIKTLKREIGTDQQMQTQINAKRVACRVRVAVVAVVPTLRSTHYPTDRGQVARFAGCPSHITEVHIP